MEDPPLALADPLRARREARQRRLRVALPLIGVVLVVAAILGIALFVDRANRAGVLTLADDVLVALEQRVGQQVAAFLDPVAQAARLAAEVAAADGPLNAAASPNVERVALAILRDTPQVTLFSLGDQDGNYLQVRRGAEGFDSKRIRNAPGDRQVAWIRRGADGATLREETDPNDSFDPRSRPWYSDALTATGLNWTAPYIFFADRAPGITASIAIPGTAAGTGATPRGVVGLDIALAELSRFLGGLQVGRSGQALIIDGEGKLVAARDAARALKLVGDTLVATRPDELGDPVITRAWDMARMQRRLRRSFVLGEQRHIVVSSPLEAQGTQGWTLLMTAPEADFAGFVESNSRAALVMSGAVVALTLLLASVLVRQGLRSDRAVRRMLDQGNALAMQSAAFARLGAAAGLFDRSGALPPTVMEELAAVTGARRASLWRFSADGRVLRCEDAYDATAAAHTSGAELHVAELPRLFAALAERGVVSVADAAADPRTADLHRLWLDPLGSTALVAVPVVVGDRLLGGVWIEDPAAAAVGVAEFGAAVSNMLALRLDEAAPVAAAPVAALAPSVPVRRDAESLRALRDAALAGVNRHDFGADVFPDVAVLVLRFTDTFALARRPTPELSSRLDQVACALQTIALEHGLPYLKLLGEEVVLAAGFAGPEDDAPAERIATAALEIRSRCATLFEGFGEAPEFRLGLDCGMAIGTTVGNPAVTDLRVFNLWGEAVRGAGAMAVSALPGSVQATEAAYARLRQGYLLRPRGRFWVPRQGERRTYVLAGQL